MTRKDMPALVEKRATQVEIPPTDGLTSTQDG
jgi:hypothetical protein